MMSAKKAFGTLEKLWEEITPNGLAGGTAFDDKGKCLKCGSKVSLADVRGTLVFVGTEVVKRHDGDISNRNCMRCTYPELYPDYEHYDEE